MAISISSSFARITKENTLLLADECLKAPSSSLRHNNQCSRAVESTGFCVAPSRPPPNGRKKQVTSATKSNGITITMPFWDERFKVISAEYPLIKTNQFHIDILTAHFVQHPDWFDVVVGSNLFGDILSDLGPACTGTIGIAPSANLNPERVFPSMFEPVHGSAPDIAGKGIANPIGQIWSGAMMLEHLGEQDAAGAIIKAIEKVLETGPKTRDIGGSASTEEVGKAIAAAVSEPRDSSA